MAKSKRLCICVSDKLDVQAHEIEILKRLGKRYETAIETLSSQLAAREADCRRKDALLNDAANLLDRTRTQIDEMIFEIEKLRTALTLK